MTNCLPLISLTYTIIPKFLYLSILICKKYQDTGKSITPEQAARICEVTDNLSSYVQHLSWVVWYKSNDIVTDDDISTILEEAQAEVEAAG